MHVKLQGGQLSLCKSLVSRGSLNWIMKSQKSTYTPNGITVSTACTRSRSSRLGT